MKEQYKIIFDMDGTLYSFDKGKGQTFTASRFYADLKSNVFGFFMEKRGLSRDKAMREYERIDREYDGEISVGVATEYGITRSDYFANTWNINPEGYIKKDPELPGMLAELTGKIALLTAAPRVWATNVLTHLDIVDAFEGKIYTSESDERKPSPRIFKKVADDFSTSPEKVISIGDQEHSDILPAKSIGMRTVFIGSSQNTTADFQAKDVKLAIKLLKLNGLV